MTASVVASPSPSSIMRPYWKPEQPPPCTNTRRPALVLFSSDSSSLILVAAVGVTLIISTVLLCSNPGPLHAEFQGPFLIIHWRRGLPSYRTHLAARRLRLDRGSHRGRRPGHRAAPGLAGRPHGHAGGTRPCPSAGR